MSGSGSVDLYLNSDFRDNGTPADFDTNMYATWPGDDSQMVKLESWSIPMTCPNIREGWNNRFRIVRSDGVTSEIRIPEGYYTFDQLINYMFVPNSGDIMDGAGWPVLLAGDIALATDVYRLGNPTQLIPYCKHATETWYFVATTDIHRRFYKRLGILDHLTRFGGKLQTTFTSAAACRTYYNLGDNLYNGNHDAWWLPDLAHRYIDVCTNLSTNCVSNNKGSHNIIKRIFISDVGWGDLISPQANYESSTVMHAHSNAVQRFKVFLLTDEGLPWKATTYNSIAFHFSVTSAITS